MKKFIFLAVGVFALFMSGCVESSQKYKALQSRLDSLNVAYSSQNAEMEGLFSDLNDISAGMQSLREAENMLAMQATDESGKSKSKQQMAQLKNDVQAISDAIAGYKEQIRKLEGKNARQSAEFKKLIASLNAELDMRNQKIEEITKQLADRDQQIAVKTQQVNDLTKNVENLDKETKSQQKTISEQDQTIHMVNYLVGERKELKEANVISRQGIFCPPIVSSQAQNAAFTSKDMRELQTLPLNSKKAKILSVHPAGSYTLEAGEDGMLTLKIADPAAFWKQTRYLVVMIG